MNSDNLNCFDSIAALPPSAAALLDQAGRSHLFSSRPWYESFVAAAVYPGERPFFLTLGTDGGDTKALIACRRCASGDPAIASLTNFYSCDFRPLISDQQIAAQTASDLGRAMALRFSGEAVIGFDSLDSTLPILTPFLAGLARPGRALLRYAHFGRWWENIDGRGFAEYLSARDGALREVVRRKGARLARDGAVLSLVDGDSTPEEIAGAIADYETVYANSWKEPEPFADFQPVLMRKLAEIGWLRLAICRLAERPIAAQLWVVVDRSATVLKLAHDRAFDRQSPGSVLTAFAIRTLMERDNIAKIDFGRGDDAYKRSWSTNRTAHIGVLSVDIRRRPILVARHWIGAFARRSRRAGVDR